MKDLFKAMLIEPFTENDWSWYILGVLMWICTVCISGLIICGIIWGLDSSYLPLKSKAGIISGKYYYPEHTDVTYMTVNKVMTPIYTYVDETYTINVTVDKLSDEVSIYSDNWNTLEVGDTICVEYTNGRILNSMYIKSFCK